MHYGIRSLVIFILSGIVVALITFHFKKTCAIPKQRSGKLFIALFITALFFWIVESVFTLTNIIISSDEDSREYLSEWLGILPKTCYNIARMVMLFYFIIKSFVVFHRSTYSVTKSFIWILCILSWIAFGLQIAPLVINVIQGRNKSNVYFICSWL